MLGLTAMLLHWKAWLAKVNPNWIAGASILLLLVIALSPYARARQWPAISWDSLAIGVLGAVLAVVIIGATTWPFIRAQKPPAETNFKVETKIDTQVQLDLAHLLDFAVCETTYWLLDDLIKNAPDVAVAGNKLDFSSDLSATYQKASDYIRHVAVQLGFRTDRQIMFANLMESAIGAMDSCNAAAAASTVKTTLEIQSRSLSQCDDTAGL